MKKNLRIVSAAAAALLAVAPVAATAVNAPVNAAVQNSSTQIVMGNNFELNGSGEATAAVNAALAKINPNLKAVGGTNTAAGNNNTQHVAFNIAWTGNSSSWNAAKSTVQSAVAALFAPGQTLTASGLTPDFSNDGIFSVNQGGTQKAIVFQAVRTLTNTTPATPADTASDKINAGSSSVFADDANTNINITATAKTSATPSVVNGNIVVTLDGKSYTAMLHNDANGINTKIYTFKKGTPVEANDLTAGHYWAVFNNVSLNLGNSYANKKVKLSLNRGGFQYNNGTASSSTHEFTADANGVVNLGTVAADFFALNPKDAQGVHFYDVKTGDIVTSGTATMHAVNNKLNVQSVFAELTKKYVASQLTNGQGVETLVPVNDIRDQLKKQNIDVDANGYFTAPASFSINMNAKSNNNGATASMPVTVTVDNAAAETPATETTKNVTVMHIATIYDKTGKATNEPALRAYNSVSVVSEPVTINGAKFYKLAGKDQYIKVGNIDGTSRSLKKNSYIYKSNGKAYTKKVGKKAKKTVKKAGSSVTTYGKSFMINGSQMYRVGRNQYIKKANF